MKTINVALITGHCTKWSDDDSGPNRGRHKILNTIFYTLFLDYISTTTNLPIQQPLQITPRHLLHLLLGILPPKEHRSREKDNNINPDPGEQNSKIQADSAVSVEENGPRSFDDVVEGPGVAPFEEAGFEGDGVEGCADVGDDPEDEPEGCPLGWWVSKMCQAWG